MSANVGKIDRMLRAIVGLVLLALALSGTFTGTMFWVGLVVGAVALATAGMKFCPAYRLLGVNTCKL
ncbi:MAG: DUF2892 domain-containing protein [Rhodobacteraceae bacterium]|nr:DUF2892 domain-containing protein [Paracoccaceae bacterium]